MGHAELARDDARSDTVMRHLHDFVADVVREGSAVYEDPAELVHSPLS